MKAAGPLCLALAGLVLGAAVAAPAPWVWPAGRTVPHIPADNPMSEAKVELGRRLFYDADLSIDGSMSCSTCHVQRHAFADSTATHPGVHGDPGRRNAPGLTNVAWAKSLTWGDPRVTTLEAQMLIPVLGTAPIEMGMRGNETAIAERLSKDACYRSMFGEAFPGTGGRIDIGTVGMALAAFQRSLVSNRSPFDRWRSGDTAALSAVERRGADAFARDCAACHSGPDLTDGRFHAVTGGSADRGLSEITRKASDDGRFRTPGLRNLTLTAPYLHDGSALTIGEAIDRHGNAVRASGDRTEILAFLDTLTDRAFAGDPHHALPQAACGVPL